MKQRLAAAIKSRQNALCVGIDPHAEAPTAAFLESFTKAHVDAAAGLAPAVKFQAAFYEAAGARGVAILEKATQAAKDRGLFVILDAKRGDIASTMKAYGQMAYDVMGADALTVTPYMGLDVVEPLRPWLEKGRGIYAVWVSSNASGALVQDLVAEKLLTALELQMRQWGVADALGLVLGATKLDEVERLGLVNRVRDHSLLMPGVGAQGAEVTPALRALLQAGSSLVPISRGLSQPAPSPCAPSSTAAHQPARASPRADGAGAGLGATNWLDYTETLRTRIRAAAAELTV